MDKSEVRTVIFYSHSYKFVFRSKVMNIIGHKYIFLTISGLLVLASFISLAVFGLRPGIDFTGGSLLEARYKNAVPEITEIKKVFEAAGHGDVIIQPSGGSVLLIRFAHVGEEEHQKIFVALKAQTGGGGIEELQFTTIGPTIGAELKQKSFLALGLASLGIIVYLAYAFRNVSKPVSSWKYGLTAVLVAFLHDVPIPAGVFAILGHYRNVSVDTLFITALLTILGFSVHDTIVVFDRIRENLRKLKSVEPYEATVNRSVNETIARSINTSLTVLLVLVAIFFLGGETTKYFALALILGIIFGTYSSIFVASPLLVIWSSWTKRK